MNNWQTLRLDELGNLLNSRRIPLNSREREQRKGIYPYYGASGIVDYVDDYIFEGEHVLISEDGENLRTRQTPIAFKANGKFWVNNHAHIFKGKQDWINDYVVYYFQNSDINPFITGAVQPKLNKENLLRIPIIFPPEEKAAQRIVEILSSLDDKIELNRQMNATLEAMARALFKAWFVDFEPVRANADNRPSESASPEIAKLFPSEFENGIPKGWAEGTVSGLAVISKKTISPNKFQEEQFYHFSIPAFDEGKRPKLEEGRSIQSNKFLIERDSVLVSKLNPRFFRVWTAYAPKDHRCIASTEFIIYQPHNKNYWSFLNGLMRSDEIIPKFQQQVTGTSSSHQRVKPEGTLNLGVIIPDEETAKAFNKIISPVYLQIEELIKQSQKLSQLRDLLLPRLISGKIPLAELESMEGEAE